MALQLKSGQTVRVTINKAIRREAARKTLMRLFMQDKAIRQPIVVNGVALSVTASVGIAGASIASSAEELLRGADVAMYRAKSMGRDRIAR